jgi:hypothetical protein
VSKFSDHKGLDWQFEFDCFLLDRVDKEAKVDLADLSAGGLFAVVRDAKALGRVLAVVCAEQLKERSKSPAEFIKQIRKDALIRAREAVLEALADFFPATEWSAMQSALTTRRNQPEMSPEQMQMAVAFTKMDKQVQRDVMSAALQEIAEGGSLQLSPGGKSVHVPDAMPPTPVDDSPESAE